MSILLIIFVVVFLFAKATLRQNAVTKYKDKTMQLGSQNEPAFKVSSRRPNSTLKKKSIMTFPGALTAGIDVLSWGQDQQKAELLLYPQHSDGHRQELGSPGTSSLYFHSVQSLAAILEKVKLNRHQNPPKYLGEHHSALVHLHCEAVVSSLSRHWLYHQVFIQ